MFRRIVLGLVYFVVFYVVILIGIGAWTGTRDGWTGKNQGTAGPRNTLTAQNAGESRIYRVAAAALLSCIGTVAGFLPGTRPSLAASEPQS